MDEAAAADAVACELMGLSLQDENFGELEMRRNDVSLSHERVEGDCARTTSSAARERERGPFAMGLIDMAGEVLR